MTTDRLIELLSYHRDFASLHLHSTTWLPAYLDLVAQYRGVNRALPVSDAVRELLAVAQSHLDDRDFRDFVISESDEGQRALTSRSLDIARMELQRLSLALDIAERKAQDGEPS